MDLIYVRQQESMAMCQRYIEQNRTFDILCINVLHAAADLCYRTSAIDEFLLTEEMQENCILSQPG